jgi:hypothetical protein
MELTEGVMAKRNVLNHEWAKHLRDGKQDVAQADRKAAKLDAKVQAADDALDREEAERYFAELTENTDRYLHGRQTRLEWSDRQYMIWDRIISAGGAALHNTIVAISKHTTPATDARLFGYSAALFEDYDATGTRR